MTQQREPAYVIDPRARAMLAEMGVRVWLPSEAVPAAPTMSVQANQTVASQTEPVAIPVRREPPLRLPVMDAPPTAALGATRYVIGNLPAEALDYDLIVLGEPCQGAAVTLLGNMLKVIQLASASAPSTASSTAQQTPRIFIAEMVPSQNDAITLQDQLTALPTKIVLALGPHAAKALLGKAVDGIPFSKQRGTVHDNIIVTYHPQQLLRQPLAKASSWQDICLVLRTLRQS